MSLEHEDKRYLFTILGFRSLASQVPLGDLLQYRLVCKEWNEIIQKQGQFKKALVTFGPDWIERELIPFHGSSLEPRKWTNVKLNRTRLPTSSAYLYLDYWRNYCEPLKILDVYRVQVTTGNLCKIINSSPNLEEIVLNHVRFTHEDSSRIAVVTDRFGRNENKNLNDRAFCSCIGNEGEEHDKDMLSKILLQGGKNEIQLYTRATLIKIKILGFFVIPCAILEVLRVRSRGSLVEFKIIKWFDKPKKVSGNLFPQNIRQRGSFLRIINGSGATNRLRTFHFIDNEAREASLLFVDMVPRQDGQEIVIPNLHLEEIEIKKGQDVQEARWGGVQLQFALTFNHRALQLITNQVLSVRKLKLSLAFGPNFDELHQLMTNPNIVHGLQSFELHFIGPVDPRPVMNFIGHLRVNHLALCDTIKGNFQGRRNFANNFTDEGLDLLPRLTSLKLRLLSMTSAQITPILNNQNLTGLTSLEIMSSKVTFNDENLLLIVQNMPKLKKLHLTHASYISEVGTTGLRPEVIAELKKSKIFHGQPSDYEANIVGPNLRQLEDLEDLSLNGCIKVGNVTLFLGILFPNLKKLDLSECPEITDYGIQFVGRNLTLEHLTIRRNVKLTFYGINQLVQDFPHIRTIYTSKSTIGRKLQIIESREHPFFPQVVKSYAEKVREAKMENRIRRNRPAGHRGNNF